MPDTPAPSPVEIDIARHARDARAGSQAAYAALFARFSPLVHGILLSRYRPAVADELTQECFANAFAHLDQLKEAGKFGPWIAAIARRTRPSGPPTHEVEIMSDIIDANCSPEDAVEASLVFRAIASLPEAYRETLVLRLVEGMSGPEIAAMTGLTPPSVRVNLHRGMAKLRETLGLRALASHPESDDGQ